MVKLGYDLQNHDTAKAVHIEAAYILQNLSAQAMSRDICMAWRLSHHIKLHATTLTGILASLIET